MATITTRAGKGSALTHQEVDDNFTGLNTELGQKEVASNKGIANGYASLDAAGKVPSAQLPSYVDDVVEVANFASLPGTGETGKIYVTVDTNKTYRWAGSSYIEISASPGSTDSLAEGSTNLYFTQARARASISASGSLSYNSSTGVMSFTDAVTSVAGRTGAVTLTSSDVGLGNVENKSSATIRGEITSSNVTTALGFTPYNATNPSGYITSSFSGFMLRSTTGISNPNSLFTSSAYRLEPNANNPTDTYYAVLTYGNESNVVGQFATHFQTGQSYARAYNSSWSSWRALLDSANYSSYALPLSGGTLSGTTYFSGANGGLQANYSGGVSFYGNEINAGALGVTGALYLGVRGTSEVYIKGGNVAIHAGNYNSYAPSLTGANATGTWAINITGNAASASTDPIQSMRDFPNGTLVTTNINYAATNGDPFVLEITGNSYGQLIPWDIQVQGYIYNDTIINHGGISNGSNISGLVAINNGGNLCFWWPYQSYWNGFTVKVYAAYGDETNRVTSITNEAKPTTAKQVNISSVIRQSLHSENFTTYAPTLTGSGASGTWGINITGNAATVSNGVYTSGSSDISGTKVFNTPSGQTYNGASGNIGLTVFNASAGDAMMTFHISNDYAGYFGLGGAENDLVWTGWSVGSSRWRMLHSGNYTSYALPLSGGTITGDVGIGSGFTGFNSISGTERTLYIANSNAAALYLHATGGSGRKWTLFSSASGGISIYDATGDVTRFTLTTSSANFSVALQQSGNQVLHAGNYTSYSPSLTGSGASGTWGINITGNAGSATTADKSSATTVPASTAFAKWLFSTVETGGTADWNHVSNTRPGTGYTLLYGTHSNGPGASLYFHPVNFEYSGISGAGNVTQLAIAYGSPGNELYMRGRYDGTWLSWVRFLNSSNYSSYALPLSGGTVTGNTVFTTSLTANTGITVNNASAAGYGINLYSGSSYQPTYGIFFAQTSNFGTHGSVTADWATYFTMNSTAGRGWIFRNVDSGNVASINNSGTAVFNGNVTAYSDERVKANWRKLDDGFLVNLANVKSGIYDRTDVEITQAGVSAQSLREVLPEAVIESHDGDLSVAYGNAAMVSAIELAKKVVALQNKVAELEARIH